MSGTLLTPDLRRILDDLARRLGILERRITSRVATPKAPVEAGPSHDGTGDDSTVVRPSSDTGPGASGDTSIAVGWAAVAEGYGAISIGNSNAYNEQTIAIGQGAEASQDEAIAIGKNSSSFGVASIAMGVGAEATTDHAVAIGTGSYGADNGATAVGSSSNASASSSTAIGGGSATGSGSTAISEASAGGSGAIAIGITTSAAGTSSVAVGYGAAADNISSVALGNGAWAKHDGAIAIGDADTTATEQVNIGTKRAFLGAPDSAPSDSHLINGQISFYLDQTGDTLKVKVKYSNGTVKTATVALT